MSRKLEVVTTFNIAKQSFGIDMIRSFLKYWPENASLTAIVEGGDAISVERYKDRLQVLEFSEECLGFNDFKAFF